MAKAIELAPEFGDLILVDPELVREMVEEGELLPRFAKCWPVRTVMFLGVADYHEGEDALVVATDGSWAVPVTVTRVVVKQVWQVTQEEAEACGFVHPLQIADLRHGLGFVYHLQLPRIAFHDFVTIVCFKLQVED
jgi:hypothetical protein